MFFSCSTMDPTDSSFSANFSFFRMRGLTWPATINYFWWPQNSGILHIWISALFLLSLSMSIGSRIAGSSAGAPSSPCPDRRYPNQEVADERNAWQRKFFNPTVQLPTFVLERARDMVIQERQIIELVYCA